MDPENEEKPDNVCVCREAGAHKGAGITACTWAGGRSLLITGDDNGKVGVWQVLDEALSEEDQAKAAGM